MPAMFQQQLFYSIDAIPSIASCSGIPRVQSSEELALYISEELPLACCFCRKISPVS